MQLNKGLSPCAQLDNDSSTSPFSKSLFKKILRSMTVETIFIYFYKSKNPNLWGAISEGVGSCSLITPGTLN
jgi:hypothetical protein